jgi:DNA-binding transcriptional MocR family regulator
VTITSTHRLVELLGGWRQGGAGQERLAATIRSLVLDGRIAVHSRLPAERTLAAALGISRATVTAAYNQLRDERYLASRQGSGSWVTLPGGLRSAPDAIVGGPGLDMRIAALPAPAAIAELYGAAVRELPRWLDHHGYDPLGLPPLREAIAARFSRRGLPTRPEQILVTNGALQALDLGLRAVMRASRRALVEIPSYPAALDALRAAGARVDAVPIEHDGWHLRALEAATRIDRPTLSYLMPDFHNPSGRLMDAAARELVMAALSRAGSYVVIDETFVDVNVDGVSMPPPAGVFGDRKTITIGSLSKSVWGGLRIGWARADPELVHRLAAVRAAVDLASPVLEQLVAVHAIERLDELVEDRCAIIRPRREALIRAIDRQLPTWRYARPAGGMFLWATLPESISTSLSIQARDHDLQLTPGPRFGAAGLLERRLRLPFTLAPEQLERAVSILARLAPTTTAVDADDRPASYVA